MATWPSTADLSSIYKEWIEEQRTKEVRLAPSPPDKSRLSRIHARKAELFEHVNKAKERQAFYDFRARRELNERDRLQREFLAREQRKRDRIEQQKKLIQSSVLNSKDFATLADVIDHLSGETK